MLIIGLSGCTEVVNESKSKNKHEDIIEVTNQSKQEINPVKFNQTEIKSIEISNFHNTDGEYLVKNREHISVILNGIEQAEKSIFKINEKIVVDTIDAKMSIIYQDNTRSNSFFVWIQSDERIVIIPSENKDNGQGFYLDKESSKKLLSLFEK